MPHGLHRRTTTTVALATTIGLALAGCTGAGTNEASGGNDETVAEPATPAAASPSVRGDEPTRAASPSTEATPVAASIETPELDTRCVIEPAQLDEIAAVRYAVPADWKVDDRCDVLDPDLEELPDSTEVDAAIFVNVSAGDFDQNDEQSPAQRDVTTWLGARAGFPAVRATWVGTGEAMSEEGRPGTTWTYDLAPGADDRGDGGILTLSTSAVDGEDEYTLAQATLDAIAQTVVIEPPAESPASRPGETDVTVLHTELGGSPFAVTYDGDCFSYRPGGPSHEASDEVCDLDPTAGAVVAAQVGDAVVGHAPPATIAVRSDGSAPPHGLAAAIEGGTVFALPAAELPASLTAIGPGGEELVTADVG